MQQPRSAIFDPGNKPVRKPQGVQASNTNSSSNSNGAARFKPALTRNSSCALTTAKPGALRIGRQHTKDAGSLSSSRRNLTLRARLQRSQGALQRRRKVGKPHDLDLRWQHLPLFQCLLCCCQPGIDEAVLQHPQSERSKRAQTPATVPQ